MYWQNFNANICSKYEKTRRYGALWAPTSSSCGGLVTFGHLEGPLGRLDSCKKKWTPIFFIERPLYTPPCRCPPPTPCTEYFFFFYFFLPPFFIGPPPYTPPPPPPPSYPLHRVVLDFTDVKKTWRREEKEGRRGPGSVFYVDAIFWRDGYLRLIFGTQIDVPNIRKSCQNSFFRWTAQIWKTLDWSFCWGKYECETYITTRTSGAYGPLVLAPAEGLGVGVGSASR